MNHFIFLLIATSMSFAGDASDLTVNQSGSPAAHSFQFKNGACTDGSKTGHNNGQVIACGKVRNAFIPPKNFDGKDLSGADFLSSDFSRSSFKASRLRNASFRQVLLSRAKFNSADASRADFRGGIITSSQFQSAILDDADFRGARIKSSNFKFCTLRNVDFFSSFIEASDLSHTDLRGADFGNAVIIGTKFNLAVYDDSTHLPFGAEVARKLGMIKVDDGAKVSSSEPAKQSPSSSIRSSKRERHIDDSDEKDESSE